MGRSRRTPSTSARRRNIGITTTTAFPFPYDKLVLQTDAYTQLLNIRPIILPLPLPQNNEEDINGIRMRLHHNRSFLKSRHNPDPQEFPKDLYAHDTVRGAIL